MFWIPSKSKGLFEMAVAIRYGENYSLNTMRDAVILGLTYVTGARPVQLAKLAAKDLRIDTQKLHSGDACTGTDSSQSIGYQSGMAKHGGYDVDW